MLLGAGSVAPELPTLSALWPGWWLLFIAVGMLGMVSNLHLLFLAPDGQFVPRWTLHWRPVSPGAMLALGGFTLAVAVTWGPLGGMVGIFVAALPWFTLLVLGILSQIYRFRHVSGPVGRQQIKWVAAGLAAVTLGILINAVLLTASGSLGGLARVWCNLARATLTNLCLMALPICLAFSDTYAIACGTLIYSSAALSSIRPYLRC